MRNERTTTYFVTRTGALLAATVILQGLRLVIPVPPPVSMFVIGSLVNACLTLAVLAIGWQAGLVIACVTPVFAWLEGMLPFLPFVLPVAAGNAVYTGLIGMLHRWRLPGICGAALGKAAMLYGSFYVLFGCLAFPAAVRQTILFVMSWPQVVTGIVGGTLGYIVWKRICRQEDSK
ncbi:hypothetical protein [uncultured Megasphaera sp.]|uniref:hypothetical protein n=1 Tax=uncultured Megasphaera sp. TaxID=165188 RepID=UPI00265A3246|nr:hypothetical protein [uncultured Megasphaera sp.]